MSTIISCVFGLQLWNLAVFLILTCSFSWWGSFLGSCVLKVVSAKYQPIVSVDMSTDTRPTRRPILDRYSVDTRSIHRPRIGRVSVDGSVDTRPRCMSVDRVDSSSTVGWYFTDTLLILHRYFTDSSPRYQWHFEFCEHYEPFLSVNQLKIKQLLFIFK